MPLRFLPLSKEALAPLWFEDENSLFQNHPPGEDSHNNPNICHGCCKVFWVGLKAAERQKYCQALYDLMLNVTPSTPPQKISKFCLS